MIALTETKRLALWPLGLVSLGLLGYLAEGALPRAVLTDDARIYFERVTPILDGKLPYVDVLFEHFPLALPPMLVPRLVPGGDTTLVYTALFGLLMLACLVAIGAVVGRVAAAAGVTRGASQWALLTAPLVPFVAYRNDPVATLLAVAAFYYSFVVSSRAGPVTALAAIAAKGWPLVLALAEWLAGRRRRAMLVGGFAAVLGGVLLLTPGFQEGRDFSGVHLETIAGSGLVWLRSATGADAGIAMAAGAIYVSAPAATLLVGVALGTATAWSARPALTAPFTIGAAARLVGVATAALLLVSPLFSAQFLLWLTPWLLFFGGRTRRSFLVAATITLLLMSLWAPTNLWWQSGLVIRNGAFLAMVVQMALEIRQPSSRAVPAGIVS